MNVLIVDDYLDVAEVFSQVVEALGHTVAIATNAEDGLNLAKTRRPDVVFLDIGLGNANGIEVCRTMRQLYLRPGCRVVAISGYAEMERQCEPNLFDGFLLKPISIKKFEDWLTCQPSPSAVTARGLDRPTDS